MTNLAQMTPQELADAGIPTEVALRAKVEEAHRQFVEAPWEARTAWHYWGGVEDGLRDALAVIEAKGATDG